MNGIPFPLRSPGKGANTRSVMNIRTLIILLSLPASGLLGAARDIQFKSINFVTSVVEMHNYGTTSQSLAGWRFCTHDENQIRRYSSTTGLNAVSIAAGESLLFITPTMRPAAIPPTSIAAPLAISPPLSIPTPTGSRSTSLLPSGPVPMSPITCSGASMESTTSRRPREVMTPKPVAYGSIRVSGSPPPPTPP